MQLIDRNMVRSAFHRQAGSYDAKAVVQKRVVESLVERIRREFSGRPPQRILDIGTGTGMLLRELRNMFPDSLLAGIDLASAMGRTAMLSLAGKGTVICVEGDAESLPFADGTFDLVLSTSTFQWLNGLETAFSEARRVLAPEGSFLFSLFGEGTLRELQDCYRKAIRACSSDAVDRIQYFFSADEVYRALCASGFRDCRSQAVVEREYHDDVAALLRSLRDIGAGNASKPTSLGLGGRSVMLRMMEIYEKEYSEGGMIPATYGVVFGEGKKQGTADHP